MTVTLRQAEMADSALILTFIKELADHENMLHEVLASETDIRKSLFGLNPRAFCLIAEKAGKPAGFALYFYNYSTFLGKNGIYLEDLYIREEFRGDGVGGALLAHLAKKVVDEGLGRLEWWVLDSAKAAIHFYENVGARPMDDWTVYRLTGSALNRLAERADS